MPKTTIRTLAVTAIAGAAFVLAPATASAAPPAGCWFWCDNPAGPDRTRPATWDRPLKGCTFWCDNPAGRDTTKPGWWR